MTKFVPVKEDKLSCQSNKGIEFRLFKGHWGRIGYTMTPHPIICSTDQFGRCCEKYHVKKEDYAVLEALSCCSGQLNDYETYSVFGFMTAALRCLSSDACRLLHLKSVEEGARDKACCEMHLVVSKRDLSCIFYFSVYYYVSASLSKLPCADGGAYVQIEDAKKCVMPELLSDHNGVHCLLEAVESNPLVKTMYRPLNCSILCHLLSSFKELDLLDLSHDSVHNDLSELLSCECDADETAALNIRTLHLRVFILDQVFVGEAGHSGIGCIVCGLLGEDNIRFCSNTSTDPYQSVIVTLAAVADSLLWSRLVHLLVGCHRERINCLMIDSTPEEHSEPIIVSICNNEYSHAVSDRLLSKNAVFTTIENGQIQPYISDSMENNAIRTLCHLCESTLTEVLRTAHRNRGLEIFSNSYPKLIANISSSTCVPHLLLLFECENEGLGLFLEVESMMVKPEIKLNFKFQSEIMEVPKFKAEQKCEYETGLMSRQIYVDKVICAVGSTVKMVKELNVHPTCITIHGIEISIQEWKDEQKGYSSLAESQLIFHIKDHKSNPLNCLEARTKYHYRINLWKIHECDLAPGTSSLFNVSEQSHNNKTRDTVFETKRCLSSTFLEMRVDGDVTKILLYCERMKKKSCYGTKFDKHERLLTCVWSMSLFVGLRLIILILLFKSGDVELNPGPRTQKNEFGRRHSEFVELQEDNRCALIYANRFNQIALVSESSFKSHISYELLVDFSLSMGYPVLGFSCTDQINFEGFNFEKNADISLIWYLSQRSIWIGGKEVKTDMPLCSSGTVIKIDTTNGQDISFQVTNLLGGKSKESVSLSLQDVPDEVFLFVGALRTGNKFISFQLSETKAVAESISADLRFTQVKEIHTTDVTREIHLADLKVFGSTNMHISSDGKVYTRTSTEQGNSCVVLPMMIKSGRHRWTLEVRCDFGASCCVGLARFPFKLSDDYMRDPLKHIYRHPGLLLYRSYRGLLYIDGRQLERTLQPIGWQHNSSVKIMIDVNMDDKTVEIFRNGKSLGIAFREIVGPLQPVICFYASYEKEIELVSYETSEMSYTHTPAQKHSPRTPSEQQLGPKEAYFDPMYKHGSISLSNNRKSISREKSQAGNAYCLMDVECAAIGVYRFSFVIETDQGASVCIGVTDASPASIRKVDIGNIYLSPSLYLYRSFQGMLYFKGRELTKRFDEFWMSGTLVEMTVDIASDEAVIQYTVNGKDQGIAFSGLKPPLRPLIAIYAGMEKKVTMIHFEHNVPKFATPPTLGTSSSVNDINATESFASRTSLPTVTTPRNAEQPSSRECMICGGPADTILLPCMHSTFCARDASRTSTCIICGQQVDGVWNILTGVNR